MYDVAIVGGGPVGMLLAAELALQGVRPVVLERLAVPSGESKAGTLHARTAQSLDRRGLLHRVGRASYDNVLFHFSGMFGLDLGAVVGEGPVIVGSPQAWAEQVFADRALELGAEIRRGQEVTGLVQHADHVTLTLAGSPGGEASPVAAGRVDGTAPVAAGSADGAAPFAAGSVDGTPLAAGRVGGASAFAAGSVGGTPLFAAGSVGDASLDARYVVGTDGARSVVRKAAGIPFVGSGARVAALMGEVRLPPDVPGGWHRTPRGWLMVWARPGGHSRVTTYDYRGPHPDREAPVTLEELQEAASYIAGEPILMSDPRLLSRYGDAALQAESYRSGRVLLAGDAAHVHFPWGGQGLNTGLEDAFNLGWKLAAEVRGRAPAGLLDTYHAERHPVGARVLWNVRAQNALAHPDPALDPLRELFAELMEFPQVNEYLSGMISGVDTRYSGFGMAPDIEVKTPDGAVRLASLLHSGRPLYVDLASRDDLVAVVEGRVDVVRGVASSPSPWVGLLIRPDGYLAWETTGSVSEALSHEDALSLEKAVTHWFG
ncbi:FAD-dependent monooxygenase [Nonomuraea sp. NPDC050556]|uniref:FAD-dependent monooxygenase n=1 Tax=Nonomuraea sp. NPDC050556 TaxID=3364369 RepID=UPI00379DAE1E